MPWPPENWFAKGESPHALSLPDIVDRAASPYQTRLSPDHEREFHAWLRVTGAPFDPSGKSDYDMRGFWQALKAGDERATTAVNAGDGELHFPDTWKTPHHATFSDESVYAQPGAPTWHGDILVAADGRILADERPRTDGGR